jgi:hypothetical protein
MLPEGKNETPELVNIFNSNRYKSAIKMFQCIKTNAPGEEAGLAAANIFQKMLNSID